LQLKVAIVAIALGVLGCGDKPSDEDCEKLLSHVVDLYSSVPAGGRLTPQAEKDLESQKKAVQDELSKSFADQCKDKPAAVVKCQLKARTIEELGKCEDES
jgi:hypothetical protein